jgi:hypothetical protein
MFGMESTEPPEFSRFFLGFIFVVFVPAFVLAGCLGFALAFTGCLGFVFAGGFFIVFFAFTITVNTPYRPGTPPLFFEFRVPFTRFPISQNPALFTPEIIKAIKKPDRRVSLYPACLSAPVFYWNLKL